MQLIKLRLRAQTRQKLSSIYLASNTFATPFTTPRKALVAVDHLKSLRTKSTKSTLLLLPRLLRLAQTALI